MSKHGFELPQTKLPESAIRDIRRSAEKREEMRKKISSTLSNAALAKKYSVHPRTIEKVLSYETAKWVR